MENGYFKCCGAKPHEPMTLQGCAYQKVATKLTTKFLQLVGDAAL